MEYKKKILSEPCQICGDMGMEGSIMTCFNCREAREHIYCARVPIRSVPDMWLCEVCRSPTRVLQISNLVDNNTKALETNKTAVCCALRPEISMPSLHEKTSNGCLKPKLGKRASLVSSDTSPDKKQLSPFLAFPRKRRTASRRIEETKRR